MKMQFLKVVSGMLAFLLSTGCAGAPASQQMSSADEGARIWRMTCARCHNARPASEFRSDQWPIIVSHMRTRSEITRSQAEAVTAFLQQAAEADQANNP